MVSLPATVLPGLAHRWTALSANRRGALWLLASALLFAVMAAMTRVLAMRLHAFEIAFFRCVFGLVAVLPFAWRGGTAALRTTRPSVHVVRGLVGVGAMLSVFYALANLPLAVAVSTLFSKTLFTIVLAALFLGERLRPARAAATLVGFVGVLVMLRPSPAIPLVPELVAVAAAILMAVVVVLVKRMSRTEQPTPMLFYFSASAVAGAALPAFWVWQAPTPAEWLGLGAMGLIGTISQYCTLRAYRIAEATAITVVDYCQLLFAALFGYALFGEVPDLGTGLGAALIVGSSLYVLGRRGR